MAGVNIYTSKSIFKRVNLTLLFFCLILSHCFAAVDKTPPRGSIYINNNQAYAKSQTVTLKLSATDSGSGVAKMRFSNDNKTWSSLQAYATTIAWTLPSGDGTKRVYAKFQDKAGNWSGVYSDTIILDTTPPAVIITSPLDGTIVETTIIQLKGTIDKKAFTENRSVVPGINVLTKTAADSAGNTTSASVCVTLYLGKLIGAYGGEIAFQDGKVKISVPAGALASSNYIKISKVDKSTLLSAAPAGKGLLSVVECKPAGLNFKKPVQITYSLDQAEIPGTPVELGLYDSSKKKITSTGQVSTITADGYTVTFSLTHFSTYAALKSLTPQSTPIGAGVKIPLPDLLTGRFSYAIPITVPPGRKGMQPALALHYLSSNPNSWLGLGFSLNPGYIVRSTRLGPPKYIDAQDTFYFVTDAGTTELVNLIDNLYQAKVESGFTKFFKEADDSWRAVGKDGSVLRFGQISDSKEASSQGTYSWYLTKANDTNGNYIQYSYIKDQDKTYLARIDYTGNDSVGVSPRNSVEFFLESREDIPSSYISSSKIITAKRLKEIQVKTNSALTWRYCLEYTYSPDTSRSLLKSFTQYGSDGESMPVQTLSYQQAK